MSIANELAFWVYENWRAHGHQATIHRAGCRHCNNGNGARGGTRSDNGKWHPAGTVEDAVEVATATGAAVRRCGVCAP